MNFGSLFSGIGGMDLGLQRAGMQIKWQVEIDAFCQKVLAKHWPDVRRYGDVKTVGKHNLEPVDLICGGFPCQPHSVAGKRRGAEDDRNLWPEFLRVIKELRPAWVFAENVPGIVSLYLDTVLSDLEGEGYTCWTLNIPACAFNAPHIRKRIFIVAYSNRNELRLKSGWGSRSHRRGTPQLAGDGTEESLANAQGERAPATEQSKSGHGPITSSQDMAHPDGLRKLQPQGGEQEERRWIGDSGEALPDTDSERLERKRSPRSTGDREPWIVESSLGRTPDGLPARMDRCASQSLNYWPGDWERDTPRTVPRPCTKEGRLKHKNRVRAIGNAVVPQKAEWIGKQILEVGWRRR